MAEKVKPMVEQLVDASQTRALSYAIYYSTKYMSRNTSLEEVILQVEQDLDNKGLDILAPSGRSRPPNLARPRKFEVAAAINRLRSLKMICCS